jgi:hypothetical protein
MSTIKNLHDRLAEEYEVGYALGREDGYRTAVERLKAFVVMGEWCALNATPIVEREYWTSDLDGRCYYNCFCPGLGCGAYRKALDAGVHEGTDLEYCGLCRSSW